MQAEGTVVNGAMCGFIYWIMQYHSDFMKITIQELRKPRPA